MLGMDSGFHLMDGRVFEYGWWGWGLGWWGFDSGAAIRSNKSNSHPT
jgi:hypothetical protein